MNFNEVHDFFKSEAVTKLLTDAHANGYIKLDFFQIMFNDDDIHSSFWLASDKCFVSFDVVKQTLRFIDDVIHDRFDLHTLSANQFARLYNIMITNYENKSLFCKIKYYYDDASASDMIYLLPKYFVFERVSWYYAKDLTTDEAYTMLEDFIETAKFHKQIEKSEDVFYTKIKQVYSERKMITALTK